jgi:predicted transcriptional regulator
MLQQGDYDLVVAIHPQHAERILNGTKTVELRSRFPDVEEGTRVYLYATAPISAVVGGFQVAGIETGTPEQIWERNSKELSITIDEFRAYANGQPKLKAIQIRQPFRLSKPVSRAELRAMPEAFATPQGTSYLRPQSLRKHLQILTS